MSTVGVAVFTPLNRLAIPSGVPRHIIEVVGGLLRDSSLEVSFFANRAEAEKYLPLQGALWEQAPRLTFSKPVASMARLWGVLNRPSFEQLGGRANWLYLPADGYVPVKRARLAVTIHDVYKLEPPVPGEDRLDHYKARVRHWVIYRRVAAHAERILTVSRFSADRIMHHLGVPASRIEVVRNGISACFYQPDGSQWPKVRDRLGLAEGEPFFVYMGGLKAKKNGGGIIAAWQDFQARRQEGRLVILGHHDPKMESVARRELKRAVLPGRLEDDEMAILLARSTAMFFPSHYEGFGIPVVEAMAAGAPLILSDIPALRELAGSLAWYVDPEQPRDMAKRLEECLLAGHERRGRVAEGRKIAEGFRWDTVVGRVRAVLT